MVAQLLRLLGKSWVVAIGFFIGLTLSDVSSAQTNNPSNNPNGWYDYEYLDYVALQNEYAKIRIAACGRSFNRCQRQCQEAEEEYWFFDYDTCLSGCSSSHQVCFSRALNPEPEE